MLTARARDVIRRCRLIAECSEEPGYTTRTFLSPVMRAVHGDLAAWMVDLGMIVRVDHAGNLRGVYDASRPDAPRLFIGSHLDTVPHAGAFDGVLGVVLGIALIDLLEGKRFPFAIEIVGFSEEEGVRFGVPFVGSRAFTGTADRALLNRRDANGVTVAEALRQYGLDPDSISEVTTSGPTMGYLEFHIEQGPVLEAAGVPLGIVDGIVGQTRAEAAFIGAARHAGTTPMPARRDALAAAAEWVLTVEREANAVPGLVATVGAVKSEPGAGNVIAGRCSATLDVRHAEDAVRRGASERLAAYARDIATRRGLELAWTPRLEQPAISMDASLVATLERAVRRADVPVHHLSSGAGHDAMIVAARMPAAMIFLRTPGGISHHPDESVLEEDVAMALAVGRHLLDELS